MFTHSRPIHLPDPLSELRIFFRLLHCPIPAAGMYEFALLVDGDWVGRRRLLVHPEGGS
jgi:hypothetical protein